MGPATRRSILPGPRAAEVRRTGLGAVVASDAAGLAAGLAAPLGELIGREPLFVPPSATVAEVALAMREVRCSYAVISTDPPGIVTTGDLQARVLAEHRPPDTPVLLVMTRPVHLLPADAPLVSAMLLMLDEGIEHVPVVRGERIVGVITDADVVRRQTPSPLVLAGRVRRITATGQAAGYAGDLAATAHALLAEDVDPLRIGAVITSLNDALTGRLLDLAEGELGEPPCGYAWLALGSQGRMEQLLASDQDTALAYADAAPRGRADRDLAAYFAALADRVTEGLFRAGIPRCDGGFMATRWNHPVTRWRQTFQHWIDEPNAQALLDAQVFLDFRPMAGELSVAALNRPLVQARNRTGFLAAVARAARSFTPPLGLLGRIRTDRDGRVDLKMHGTVPAVMLGRLHGLAAGCTARGTADRLAAAVGAGLLSDDAAESLLDAYRALLRIRLARQIDDLAAGRTMSTSVPLAELSSVERRQLSGAFEELRTRQRASALKYPGAG